MTEAEREIAERLYRVLGRNADHTPVERWNAVYKEALEIAAEKILAMKSGVVDTYWDKSIDEIVKRLKD